MPHKCMDCMNLIDDGSIDLEKGCPVCGCKKFLYVRSSRRAPKKEQKLTVAEYVTKMAAAEPAPVEPRSAQQDTIDMAKPTATTTQHMADEITPGHERIETVTIPEKGKYYINLPMLLSRKELILSKEEGSYYVDLPSALKVSKKKLRK